MIVVLSIMDIIFSVSGPLAAIPGNSSLYCHFISPVAGFVINGFLLWTTCFAHTLFRFVMKENQEIFAQSFRKNLIITCSIATVQGAYAAAAPYRTLSEDVCIHQINYEKFDFAANIVLIMPMFLSTVYCIFCYLAIYCKIRMMIDQQHLNLFFYPFILIICNAPLATLAIVKQIEGEIYSETLMDIANVLWSLQGIFNTIAYGISGGVIQAYRKTCCQKEEDHRVGK